MTPKRYEGEEEVLALRKMWTIPLRPTIKNFPFHSCGKRYSCLKESCHRDIAGEILFIVESSYNFMARGIIRTEWFPQKFSTFYQLFGDVRSSVSTVTDFGSFKTKNYYSMTISECQFLISSSSVCCSMCLTKVFDDVSSYIFLWEMWFSGKRPPRDAGQWAGGFKNDLC